MADDDTPNLRHQLSPFHRPMYQPYDPATGEGLTRPPPTAEEINDEYVAPGAAATHPVGVLFKADHETLADGMCRQARVCARALSDAGVPLMLLSIQHTVRHGALVYRAAGDAMLHPDVYAQVGLLRHTTVSNPAVVVYHTVITSAEALRGLMLPDFAAGAGTVADRVLSAAICYTPWERTTVDPEVIRFLNRVGQVWLQCDRNAQVFIEAGLDPERIRMVPNPYDPENLCATIPDRVPERPSGARFYTIGKWEPRKNHHGLIGAFLSEFTPEASANLTIKASHFGTWKDYPAPRESVMHWLNDETVRANGWTPELVGRRILIFEDFWTDDDIANLHARGNIYVSASHAEGWDYPAFDAKTADNVLVHVGFGGSEDYADATDHKVPWHLEPAHPTYGWEKNAGWAVPTLADLRAALRVAAANPVTTPRVRRVDLAEKYNARAIGVRMRDLVVELSRATNPELSQRLEEAIDDHTSEPEPAGV